MMNRIVTTPYTDEEIETMYEDSLDEMGPIKIGTLEYSVSWVLKSVDPIAYRCGLNDYEDMIRGDEE